MLTVFLFPQAMKSGVSIVTKYTSGELRMYRDLNQFEESDNHLDYPRSEWKKFVEIGITTDDYWSWVINQIAESIRAA